MRRQELLEMVNSESANNVEAMRLDLFVNRLALLVCRINKYSSNFAIKH